MPNFTVQFSWYLDVDVSARDEGEAINIAKRSLPRCMGAPDDIECVEVEDEEDELECPLGGDETDDCADCPYAGDYHFVDGECARRED